jgi:hypothetical protein
LPQAHEILEKIGKNNQENIFLRFGNMDHHFYFYEMWPLYKLAKNIYGDNTQTRIRFTGPLQEPFDGIIQHTSLTTDQKVEFVNAIDGHEVSVRLEYAKKFGWVKGIGKMNFSGSKNKRAFGNNQTLEMFEIGGSEMNEEYSLLIDTAIKRKISKPEYQGFWLGITIDDMKFSRLNERPEPIITIAEEVIDGTREEIKKLFQRVFIIGTCTDFFYEPKI